LIYSGVDEVGYGALAGRMLAVAVSLPINLPRKRLTEFWPMSSVKDSKKTTAPQRERLRTDLTGFLIEQGAGVGVGEADAEFINFHGYSAARNKVLLDAALNATLGDGFADACLIVDGNVALEGFPFEQILEPKADGRFFVVAAASCLAKILRDDMMIELAVRYPEYGFDVNKGYGTPAHIKALLDFGLTPEHRKIPCRTALRKQGQTARPAFGRTRAQERKRQLRSMLVTK
jgi:ribonuclease HII